MRAIHGTTYASGPFSREYAILCELKRQTISVILAQKVAATSACNSSSHARPPGCVIYDTLSAVDIDERRLAKIFLSAFPSAEVICCCYY